MHNGYVLASIPQDSEGRLGDFVRTVPEPAVPFGTVSLLTGLNRDLGHCLGLSVVLDIAVQGQARVHEDCDDERIRCEELTIMAENVLIEEPRDDKTDDERSEKRHHAVKVTVIGPLVFPRFPLFDRTVDELHHAIVKLTGQIGGDVPLVRHVNVMAVNHFRGTFSRVRGSGVAGLRRRSDGVFLGPCRVEFFPLLGIGLVVGHCLDLPRDIRET